MIALCLVTVLYIVFGVMGYLVRTEYIVCMFLLLFSGLLLLLLLLFVV